MSKRMIFSIVALAIFVLTLPVWINVLLSIDTFSNYVVGEEPAWLSFYGSYLGGILGGILTLVGVIFTIRYQDRIRKSELDERNIKVTKIVDNLINKAIIAIYYVRVAVLNKQISQTDFIKSLEHHSKDLKNVVKEFEAVSWETIPPDILADFITIKEYILAVNDSFTTASNHFKNGGNKNNGGLSEVTLLNVLSMILSKHINITEEKEMLELFIKELNMDYTEVSEKNL